MLVIERRCSCRRLILQPGTVSTELGGVVHTDDGYCHYFDDADSVVVNAKIPENLLCKCGIRWADACTLEDGRCPYSPCYPIRSKETKMEFSAFVRKPFVVQAVEVTRENIAEIAKHVGDLREKDDGTPFILVDRRLVPNVYRVYPGFWMTKMGENVRCYSRRIFLEQFTNLTDDIQAWVDFMNNPGESEKTEALA